jgi:hypothetical protein
MTQAEMIAHQAGLDAGYAAGRACRPTPVSPHYGGDAGLRAAWARGCRAGEQDGVDDAMELGSVPAGGGQ